MDGISSPPLRRNAPPPTTTESSDRPVPQTPNAAVPDAAPRDGFEATTTSVLSEKSGAGAFARQAGFSGREIAELGRSLGFALGAHQALGRGDWRSALAMIDRLGTISPTATTRLTGNALGAVPGEVRSALQSAGLQTADLRSLGTALSQVHDSVQALRGGDWRMASAHALGLESRAPGAARLLGDAIAARLPAGERQVLNRLGVSDAQISQLGARLPYAAVAARSLLDGDWKKASVALDAIRTAVPGAVGSLDRAVLDKMPAELKDALGALGLNPNEVQGGVVFAADAAKALQSGDWRRAAELSGLVGDPHAAFQVSQAVSNALPSSVRQALLGAGIDEGSITKLGSALPRTADAVQALQQGDWQTAALSLPDVKGLPDRIGEKLERAILSVVPQSVKDALAKAGFTRADLKELGTALPLAHAAVQAIGKGDWRAASAALDAVQQKAPNATRKLEQAVIDLIPGDVKDALGKLGLDRTGLHELRSALPLAADTAKALKDGDWRTALRGMELIGQAAPHLTEKIGGAITEALPKDVKETLGKLGLDGRDLRELGAALPSAVDAAQAIGKGDWRTAGLALEGVRQAAPHLLSKVGAGLEKILPKEVTEAAKKFGFATENLPELGAALGQFSDAAGKLNKGDWRGALQDIQGVGRVAPNLSRRLGEELEKILPADVKQVARDLGTTVQELGAALPSAVDAVNALKKGDWKTAAAKIDAVKQAAPQTVEALGRQLDRIVPQDVQRKLEKIGSTAVELGAALPHAAEALNNIEKGDWKAAAKNIDAVKQAAPQTVAFLERELDKAVPPGVKDTLKGIGVTVAEVGAALPALTDAVDALKKGDWKAAAKSFDGLKDAAPNTIKWVTEKFQELVPQDVKDGLAKIGVAAEGVWQLGSKLGDAVDFVGQLKAGDGVKAFESLKKLVGDPDLGKKFEQALGLPEGGLNAALQKNLINLNGMKLTGLVGGGVADGKVRNDLQLKGQELLGGSFHKGVAAFEAGGKFGQPGDVLQGEGSVKLLSADLYGSGSVKADLKNFTFGATGKIGAGINLIDAQGRIKADYGFGSTEAAGRVRVGANAEAQGTVVIDPKRGSIAAELDAEAFAGVQAGVELKQKLGPVGVEGKASVSAGVGVDFGLDVGLQKGKFSFKMDIGAALGIGFDIEFGFSVDVGKILKGIGNVLEKPVKWVGDAIKKAGEAVGWVGEKVVDGVKKVGEAVVDGVKSVGSAIAKGVKKVFSGW
jgi:chemotaxis regulatin CheY-phosphate phosphatase CheZ